MSLKRNDFLKVSMCQKRPKIVTKTKSNEHFDETITARQMIGDVITGDYDPASLDEVLEDVSVSYCDENVDDIEETQESRVKKFAGTLWRYINSFIYPYGNPDPEQQACFVPEGPIYLDLTDWLEMQNTTLFPDCDDIEVRFTWIRKDIVKTDQKNMNLGTLQGVIIRKGKPDLSKTSRGANNVETDIWLHIMRHALRKYSDTFLEVTQSVNIEAAYHFLRKTTDKSETNYLIEDYFKDEDGIRKQTEIYTKLSEGVPFPDNDLDAKFREILEKYATGYDKCDMKEESDCKHCPNYMSCYFKEPPVPIDSNEETGTIKARGSIEQDEYQKIVSQYRSGTGIVDAPPGSGKTEITTERTVQIAFEILEDLVKRYEAGEDVEVPVTANFLCKDSEGYGSEILVNGKTADQNWVEIEESFE